MRFLQQTRRQYCFAIDEDWEFTEDKVKATDGNIWFPRPDAYKKQDYKTFENVEECEEWYKKRTSEMDSKKTKHFEVKSKRLKITESDWQKMTKFMPGAERFQKDEFAIYEDWLAHNFPDRDGERFSKPFLKAFDRTMPGKSKMISHAWHSPGQGVYYKSRMEKLSVEETLDFIGPHPSKKIKSILENIAQKDDGIWWLVPTFYIRKNKTELIDDIDDGSAGKSSIGFRGPEPVDVKDEDGKLLYREYQINPDKDAEGVEGSIVGVESQYGARITKDFEGENEGVFEGEFDEELTYEEMTKPFENEHACRLQAPGKYQRFARKNCAQKSDGKCIDVIYGIKEGKSEIQALRYKKTIWTASAAKSHCAGRNGSFEAAKEADKHLAEEENEGGIMKLKLESIGYEAEFDTITEEFIDVLQTQIEDGIEQKVAEVVEDHEGELESVKAVVGEDYSIDRVKQLKEQADEGQEFRKDFIEEIVRMGCLTKLVDAEKADEKREFLDDLPFNKLSQIRDEYRKAVDEKFPSKGILPDNTEDKNPDDEKKGKKKPLKLDADSSYQPND